DGSCRKQILTFEIQRTGRGADSIEIFKQNIELWSQTSHFLLAPLVRDPSARNCDNAASDVPPLLCGKRDLMHCSCSRRDARNGEVRSGCIREMEHNAHHDRSNSRLWPQA